MYVLVPRTAMCRNDFGLNFTIDTFSHTQNKKRSNKQDIFQVRREKTHSKPSTKEHWACLCMMAEKKGALTLLFHFPLLLDDKNPFSVYK